MKVIHAVKERVFIMLEYHWLLFNRWQNPTATRRSFQKWFKIAKNTDEKTIRDLFQKFQQTGNVAFALVGNMGRTHSVVTPENSTTLAEVIERNQKKKNTDRTLAADSRIKPSSPYRILLKTVQMFHYKIQCRNAILFRAERQREVSANEMLDNIYVLISMSTEYGLRIMPIFIWIVPLTNTVIDFRVQKIHIWLRHDHSTARNLQFGLQFVVKA